MIENKSDTIIQALFNFTRVIPSDTSPSTYTYSSAEGTWTLVYPHWIPTLPSTLHTSTTTPQEPTIYMVYQPIVTFS